MRNSAAACESALRALRGQAVQNTLPSPPSSLPPPCKWNAYTGYSHWPAESIDSFARFFGAYLPFPVKQARFVSASARLWTAAQKPDKIIFDKKKSLSPGNGYANAPCASTGPPT